MISRELSLTYWVCGVYSLALSIAGVLLTFLAIEQGLGIGAIGLLAATSAGAQTGARLPLGWALGIVSDRFVLIAALGAFVLGMVFALAVPGVLGLALAQLMLGTSRAGFWTASQTHVIRAHPSAAHGLARVNLVSSATALVGPIVAGAAAGVDNSLGSWVVLILGLAALGLALNLSRLPVFVPPADPSAGRVARRPGVRFASLATLAGGAWNVVVITYVPVVFEAEGWAEWWIGAVITLANTLAMVASYVCGRLSRQRYRSVLAVSSVLIGLGISCLVLAGPVPAIAVVALLLSGAGSGAVMTLGPAEGAESVHPEERGRAIAVTGTYRAVALLSVPLLVTGATLVVPVGVALLVLGVLAGGPAVLYGVVRPPDPEADG